MITCTGSSVAGIVETPSSSVEIGSASCHCLLGDFWGDKTSVCKYKPPFRCAFGSTLVEKKKVLH